MSYMLRRASAFNQPIGGWAVGRVQNFQCMLYDASSFDQDLALWSVDPESGLVGRSAETPLMLYAANAFQRCHAPWATANAYGEGDAVDDY